MSVLRRLDAYLIVLLLLTLFVVAPLAQPGFPTTRAGFRPIWDLNTLAECGPPAISGAGRGLLDGGGLLPRYVALAFHRLSLTSGDALKLCLALAYLLGALGMYGWLRRPLGPAGALLAGVVYSFSPLRLSLTYVAGDLAGAGAMAIFPLAGWAAWSFGRRATVPRALLALLAWGSLVLTSPGLAVVFAVLAVGSLLAVQRSPRALLPLAPAVPLVVWGILAGPTAAAGSTLPDFPHLYQLFSASWNAAPGTPGWIGAMPYQLSVLPLGLAGLALFLPAREDGPAARRSIPVLAAGIVLTLFLALRPSAALWQVLHLASLGVTPAEMLGLSTLGLALLAGVAIRREPRLGALPGLAGLVALVVVATYGYLEPAWTTITPRAFPVAIFGADQVALVGYRLTGTAAPGAAVQLDVTWQALQPLQKDYTVFVQALDATQTIRGQEDIQPQAGKSPTSGWTPGQIITDTYSLQIDPAGPAGSYQLILGLYDWQTGQRLSAGADDRVMLGADAAASAPCREALP